MEKSSLYTSSASLCPLLMFIFMMFIKNGCGGEEIKLYLLSVVVVVLHVCFVCVITLFHVRHTNVSPATTNFSYPRHWWIRQRVVRPDSTHNIAKDNVYVCLCVCDWRHPWRGIFSEIITLCFLCAPETRCLSQIENLMWLFVVKLIEIDVYLMSWME
jgi:hypothetical protein